MPSDEDDLDIYRPGPSASRRIHFSDGEDSDGAYHTTKQEREKAHRRRKGATAPSSSTTTVTTKIITKRSERDRSAMVGRKPKATSRVKKRDLEETYDEHELPDELLPGYLKRRKAMVKAREEKLGDAGLQEVAAYDDLELDRNLDLAQLQEKPYLPHVDPPGAYEDLPIGWSGGCIPAPIAQYLKPYQIDGADFLMKKFISQEGGILGDDMGLGKTIQVIAFLTAVFGKFADERDARRMRAARKMGDGRWYPRVLIVCPGTLMSNWRSELDRWGWWHIYIYHGSANEKEEALAAARSGMLEIMITTYDSYRLNEEAINKMNWDCVVADECHKIKEYKAEVTKAMNAINSLCRIGLTGTAIQNKYEELWTLLNWTNPGAFSTLANWKTSICVPLKLGQSHDATNAQLATARRTAEKLSRSLLKPFFLRRTKALIAHELPRKSDRVVFCPLTEKQADAYDNFCDHPLVHAMRDHAEPCYCGSGKKRGWCCEQEIDEFGKWHHHVFPVLHTLQKLSNHLMLLVPTGEADEKHDKDLQKLQIALPETWKQMYAVRDSMMLFANPEYCGKWKVLKRLLKLWHDNGDKVLIFSHSVRLLKMLRTLLGTTSYNVSYLDGSMAYDERQEAVDRYNSSREEFIFLISTKAGGVGLNITSANKVVVVDPNWNPAYDLQAQDRAYRIGQVRDVEVFRLISAGTIEEIVYARQIYKQQQANIGYSASVERRYFKGVQDQKDKKGEIFGLANLFAPLKENVVLQNIVNKTNIAETRAGVEIVGLDLEAGQEDDDFLSSFTDKSKEDAAMSLLAAEILDDVGARMKAAKEMAKKKDPVQAILASAGVEYTHENAQVIGTSRIETKLSSRAQKAGNDIDHSNHPAFTRGSSQVEEHVYRPREATGDEADDDAMNLADRFGKIRYRYRPPIDVRKRQFCTMARECGYDDVTEFAMLVEGLTQEQRRQFLEKFYEGRRKKLAAVL